MTEQRLPIQDVNIELGDDVSRMLYEASKATHQNRPDMLEEMHESFSGLRAIPLRQFNDQENLYVSMAFDGVGTKVEVSERLDNHSVVAHDLFAMVSDDAVVRGAEPVAIGSILDVRQPEDNDHTREVVGQLARGYVEAARLSGVVVVNGEVAELGDRVGGYGEFNYNWGATVLWLAHRDRMLTGRQIRPGDKLVGLEEQGFRSNGITDVRKAMLEHHGPQWHNTIVPGLGRLSLGEQVQKPSTIYTRLVTELTGGFDIYKEPRGRVTGVAHITGGGQPSKLGRMLEPSGYGVKIDDPIDPPRIMQHVQELRNFDDEKAYRKWHMGAGMVIATPEPNSVLEVAEEYGIGARVIGSVTDEPGIQIRNRGARQSTPWLYF